MAILEERQEDPPDEVPSEWVGRDRREDRGAGPTASVAAREKDENWD